MRNSKGQFCKGIEKIEGFSFTFVIQEKVNEVIEHITALEEKIEELEKEQMTWHMDLEDKVVNQKDKVVNQKDTVGKEVVTENGWENNVSSCCHAEFFSQIGGDEGTSHWECSHCHKPCDVISIPEDKTPGIPVKGKESSQPREDWEDELEGVYSHPWKSEDVIEFVRSRFIDKEKIREKIINYNFREPKDSYENGCHQICEELLKFLEDQ